jgi:hypothetical protein
MNHPKQLNAVFRVLGVLLRGAAPHVGKFASNIRGRVRNWVGSVLRRRGHEASFRMRVARRKKKSCASSNARSLRMVARKC